jgi:hypothetical protein
MFRNKSFTRWLSVICMTMLLGALAGCGSNEAAAPPAPPAGVAAAAGTSQAVLNWTAVNGATSYKVYYGAAAGVTTTTATNTVTGLATPGCTVSGLLNGTPYYFVVTALSGSGESPVSAEVTATPLAKPQGITAVAGDGKVTVSWSSAAGATAYNIYYGTAAGVTIATGTKLADAVSPREVTGLTNGTPYYFVVTAVNSGGESVVSSEKSATPAVAPQPPPNPTGVAATSASAGQTSVSWNAVTGATSYNIYHLQAATAPTTATVIASGTVQASAASPTTVVGLTSGTTNWFVVTAVNAVGESGGQTNPKSVVVQ